MLYALDTRLLLHQMGDMRVTVSSVATHTASVELSCSQHGRHSGTGLDPESGIRLESSECRTGWTKDIEIMSSIEHKW